MDFSSVKDAFIREVETNYTVEHTAAITAKYWYIPYVSCAIYLVLVYLGSSWMANRSPYNLRPLLVLWNLALTVLSVTGTYIMLPELGRYVIERGFITSVCTTAIYEFPMLSFWAYIFVLSKIVEFGDTFFVVVHKNPLRFLHWYHHVTVCVFSWYSLSIKSSVAHWYCAMNYFVHSIMYSYYFFKSLKFRIPNVIATSITVLQLVQFAVGLVVTIVACVQFWYGPGCPVDNVQLTMGLTIYGSYLVLFSQFFYERYLKPSKKPKEQ